ncbi:N-acetyltransferase [Flammeovirga sp. OC4]|uniref:GNAT family N-acetyltransferase n=1 Tax=Flammeovirga sp. OC4 TaxID=1382345 RepID=UPI0005C7A49D|nr:hypothetical protein [Flammeovirga sp. OC4]
MKPNISEFKDELNQFLMNRFKYKYPPADYSNRFKKNLIIHNKRKVDIYIRFHMNSYESIGWKTRTLIIARIYFKSIRKGHGTAFLKFLTERCKHYGFDYIGVESINPNSRAFGEKFGFHMIGDHNMYIEVDKLKKYFKNN